MKCTGTNSVAYKTRAAMQPESWEGGLNFT